MGNNIKNDYKIINETSNNIPIDKITKYSETTSLTIHKKKKLIKRKNINYNLRAVFIITSIILFFILRTIYYRIYSFFTENENDDDDDEENINPDNETIYFEEKFDSYIEAFNKSKNFINNNIKGKLLNSPPIKLQKTPKISVVIPCRNCKKYILRNVRSIQNQNYSNFEIIIVDDASDDGTSLTLEKLQKEDPRLKIINNKVNMGGFYSRSIGTFSAKGKHIFTMDSDDMYLDEYVLSSIKKIAYKGNFDIIIFNSICTDLKPDVYTTNIFLTPLEINNKPNRVLFQPDLGYIAISPSDNIEIANVNEIFIRPKCVKTKVYQKALNKYGEQRYLRYMIADEDILGNYILFNTAEVAKYVPKYGYLYINNQNSFSKTQKDKVIFTIYRIYLFDAMIDFSLDIRRNKKVLVNFILSILNNIYLKDALNSNEYNNNLFISCLDRFFNCSLISDENKNLVTKRCLNLGFINYNFTYFNNSISEEDFYN